MGETTNDDKVDYYRGLYVHDLDEDDWVKVIDEFAHDLVFEMRQMREKLRFFLYTHYTWFHYPSKSIFSIQGAVDDLFNEMEQLFMNSKKYQELDWSINDYNEGVDEWTLNLYP